MAILYFEKYLCRATTSTYLKDICSRRDVKTLSSKELHSDQIFKNSKILWRWEVVQQIESQKITNRNAWNWASYYFK